MVLFASKAGNAWLGTTNWRQLLTLSFLGTLTAEMSFEDSPQE